MAVSFIKSEGMATSTISFAHEIPFLAGGTVADAAGLPALRIFRTSPGELLELSASFPSPAGFSRVSWAKPTWSNTFSCQAGLVAGGLENGVVAVWNPDVKLRKLPYYLSDEKVLEPLPDGVESWSSRDFMVIDNYVDHVGPEKRALPLQPECTTSWKPDMKLRKLSDEKVLEPQQGGVKSWMGRKVEIIDNYIDQLAPDRRVLHVQVPAALEQKTGNLMSDEHRGATGMVAMFAQHSGQVRGLSFSPHAPNVLASGAADGRVLLFDLTHPLAETTPATQLRDSQSTEISYLSWSPSEANILATTSNRGKTFVWDVNAKGSPCRTFGLEGGKCSIVDFWPRNSHYLLVAAEDDVSVWDMRKEDEQTPRRLFGNSQGITAMAWCPDNNDLLLVCTKSNKILIWNMQTAEVVSETSVPAGCLHAAWSRRGHLATVTDGSLNLYKLDEGFSKVE